MTIDSWFHRHNCSIWKRRMANIIGSIFCSPKDGPKHLFMKICMILSLAQFLIVCICSFAAKDSLIYLYLSKLQLTIYLPSSIPLPENYNTSFITGHAHRAFRLLQRGSWQENYVNVPPINFTWLENNPVYSPFGLKEAKVKKRVTVLVIVSSAPRRIDRRQAIRDTWWTECKTVNEVIPECIFMTDYQKEGESYHDWLKIESQIHKDIYFQHVPGGITFGVRMLNHMVFALTQYDFDYFTRVDDDYFFCFDQFLREVPVPMVTDFHWGWVHTEDPIIIRPEESMILFSRDKIQMFIEQDPDKILCHPWGDQMIGVWSNELNMTYLYRHDSRIHHIPIVSKEPSLRHIPNICSEFIAVHGTYPQDMRLFWTHHKASSHKWGQKTLLDNSVLVPLDLPFEWNHFINLWNYEPKYCITNPTWDTSKQFVLGGAYSGRQDEGKGRR